MTELVDAEYERLVRESADLKHEYGQLRERPSDYEAHEYYHAKVLAHIVACAPISGTSATETLKLGLFADLRTRV